MLLLALPGNGTVLLLALLLVVVVVVVDVDVGVSDDDGCAALNASLSLDSMVWWVDVVYMEDVSGQYLPYSMASGIQVSAWTSSE